MDDAAHPGLTNALPRPPRTLPQNLYVIVGSIAAQACFSALIDGAAHRNPFGVYLVVPGTITPARIRRWCERLALLPSLVL